jgi:hypothetical protein
MPPVPPKTKTTPAQRFAQIFARFTQGATEGERGNAERKMDGWLKRHEKTRADIPSILAQAVADDAAAQPPPPPSDPRDGAPHPFDNPEFTPADLVEGIVAKYVTMKPHTSVIYALWSVRSPSRRTATAPSTSWSGKKIGLDRKRKCKWGGSSAPGSARRIGSRSKLADGLRHGEFGLHPTKSGVGQSRASEAPACPSERDARAKVEREMSAQTRNKDTNGTLFGVLKLRRYSRCPTAPQGHRSGHRSSPGWSHEFCVDPRPRKSRRQWLRALGVTSLRRFCEREHDVPSLVLKNWHRNWHRTKREV